MLDEEKRPLTDGEEMPAADEQQAEQEKSNSAFEWLRCLVGVVLVLVLIFTFVAQTFTVQGPSMQNTLYGGDKLLVIKAELCDIEVGDVVVDRETFSVTRADHVDFSVLSDKTDRQNETGFQVTADILSLTVPEDFDDNYAYTLNDYERRNAEFLSEKEHELDTQGYIGDAN